MKTLPLVFALILPAVVRSLAWEVSFHESLPDDPRWVMGGVPLTVTEENGVKAVDFSDDAFDASASLNFPFSPEIADEALASGFTLDIRLRHVTEGGNFLVLVRLPGLLPLFFAPYLEVRSGKVSVSGFDGAEGKSKSVPLEDVPEFLDLKAVYRPAEGGGPGRLVIQSNGQTILELQAAASGEGSQGAAGLELGARTPERTGRTLVQSLRLAIP